MSFPRCLAPALLLILVFRDCSGIVARAEQISRDALRDKIRGAWAGQMIGVAFGAPTEFQHLGEINDAEIQGDALANAIDQDDLYVEMTFAEVMDKQGIDADSVDYGEAFKNSKYPLWHANAAARRNLNRGIPAPMSGHPQYNIHADDIDFQIEADFIGVMCPGLPQASNAFCDRVGRVMNHGDGVYGGMFVCGMYATAFFEDDPRKIVMAGMACIPQDSSYAHIISDVLSWSAEEQDWRSVWRKVERKWNRHDLCPEGVGRPFNIDAKLNGAYIAIGLLYGQRDWQQTMEITTRCGQDSDCNPASALGILGAMRGYRELPARDRDEIQKLADVKFRHTQYSFNDIVRSTETRALAMIARAGGVVTESDVTISRQEPRAPQLDAEYFGKPREVLPTGDARWTWQGPWREKKGYLGAEQFAVKVAEGPGCEATLVFRGGGLALSGDLTASGGRADIYLDGVKHDLIADAYVLPDTHDMDLWRVQSLAPGEHMLRLVMREDADPRSTGRYLTIIRAVAYDAP